MNVSHTAVLPSNSLTDKGVLQNEDKKLTEQKRNAKLQMKGTLIKAC